MKFQEREVTVDFPFPLSFEVEESSSSYRVIRGWEREYDEEGTTLLCTTPYEEEGIGKAYFLLYVESIGEGWKTSVRIVSPLSIRQRLREIICVSSSLPWRDRRKRAELRDRFFLQVHDYGLFLTLGTVSCSDANTAVAASKVAVDQLFPHMEEWLSAPHNALGTEGWGILQGAFKVR